jgi:hypothetical protein
VIPWQLVDKPLVHGQVIVDPRSGQDALRFPSLAVLAKQPHAAWSGTRHHHAARDLCGFVLWRKGCYGSRRERDDVFAPTSSPSTAAASRAVPSCRICHRSGRASRQRCAVSVGQQVNGYVGSDDLLDEDRDGHKLD